MSSHRVAYTDLAHDALKKMSAERLHGFRQDIRRVAIDPCGFGDPVGGLRDKRRAVLAGTVTDYWISGSVLTVTVVTIVHTD